MYKQLTSPLSSSPFYSLSLPVVTQIRGHIAGSFPPLSTTDRALHFYREKISALSSLVDSRRIVLTHARRSHQLILFLFLQINSKSRHGGIRTHGSTLAAFEGYHESTGGTGYMYPRNSSTIVLLTDEVFNHRINHCLCAPRSG